MSADSLPVGPGDADALGCEEPDVTDHEGWQDNPDWQKDLRTWMIACEDVGVDPRTGAPR